MGCHRLDPRTAGPQSGGRGAQCPEQQRSKGADFCLKPSCHQRGPRAGGLPAHRGRGLRGPQAVPKAETTKEAGRTVFPENEAAARLCFYVKTLPRGPSQQRRPCPPPLASLPHSWFYSAQGGCRGRNVQP